MCPKKLQNTFNALSLSLPLSIYWNLYCFLKKVSENPRNIHSEHKLIINLGIDIKISNHYFYVNVHLLSKSRAIIILDCPCLSICVLTICKSKTNFNYKLKHVLQQRS